MDKKSERCLVYQICSLVILASCLTACNPITASDERWLVMPDRAGNRITVTVVDHTAVLDIYSERGLGRADVRWVAGDYPAQILLRLHLRGLEELRFSYATTTITLSLSSTGDGGARQQYVSGAAPEPAQPSAPDSPYWMKTTIKGQPAQAQNPMPLTTGWIEVALPPHFLQERYTGFTLQWVDFYR